MAADDERGESEATPQGMLHRKVLDVAAANPNASTEDVASEVGEVSRSFVERVFTEYGDPAGGDRPSGPGTGSEASRVDGGSDESRPADGGQSTPRGDERPAVGQKSGNGSAATPESHADLDFDLSELSPEQVETLRIVHEDPSATQRAVAERLGRDRSTVAKRVNEIPGFGWATRRELVEILFEDGEMRPDSESARADETTATVTDGAGAGVVDGQTGVDGRPDSSVDADADTGPASDVKTEDDANVNANGQSKLSNDPELVHKVAHACLDAEYITTDEELRVLRRLLAGSG